MLKSLKLDMFGGGLGWWKKKVCFKKKMNKKKKRVWEGFCMDI